MDYEKLFSVRTVMNDELQELIQQKLPFTKNMTKDQRIKFVVDYLYFSNMNLDKRIILSVLKDIERVAYS
ncbi:hypothetical protein PWH33_06995 [Streptococcus suis]|uniref:hypothetical protein n=1 Tax=Streptococcus suis TaxID=1307 RepID=UPI003F8CC8D2